MTRNVKYAFADWVWGRDLTKINNKDTRNVLNLFTVDGNDDRRLKIFECNKYRNTNLVSQNEID